MVIIAFALFAQVAVISVACLAWLYTRRSLPKALLPVVAGTAAAQLVVYPGRSFFFFFFGSLCVCCCVLPLCSPPPPSFVIVIDVVFSMTDFLWLVPMRCCC